MATGAGRADRQRQRAKPLELAPNGKALPGSGRHGEGAEDMTRHFLRTAAAVAAMCGIAVLGLGPRVAEAQAPRPPNILIIWGDDIGWYNLSAYNLGVMGYRTPNIDRIGREGAMFTDWYGQQSCTAGRAAFITGQSPIRTGLTKVGLPGADVGLRPQDPTIAELLKPLGYATGQFGK